LSGKFTPVPLPRLLELILRGLSKKKIFNFPSALFYKPEPNNRFRLKRYGQVLENPVGVAAGPHTQLALNIVASWLHGARYIELKTIQILDNLEVTKPCIDMADEGYNCEWSQELTLDESFIEYLHAWILIHILHRELGFEGDPGTMFNMSVGYNLEGILTPKVQRFLSRMRDCSRELDEAVTSIANIYPQISDMAIPTMISDHVTLSTMHGCPPDEIGRIADYLLTNQHLHTTIKLNPTLLGPEKLRDILNHHHGYLTEVPDEAFNHDLKYGEALEMIAALEKTASVSGKAFGIKLTNTLESKNRGEVFPANEPMMYMSGRGLHPISIALANKLQHDFEGRLDISFSAGVDCHNLPDVLAAGMRPVTVCSDLLKPGGYGRLTQYLDRLGARMDSIGAGNLDELIIRQSGDPSLDVRQAALLNLKQYSSQVLTDSRFYKDIFRTHDIKTNRSLEWFDCIHAPCSDTCPTHQNIPEYMRQVTSGNLAGARETVLETNPFPMVTGMVCDHPCQIKCTRIHYDEALRIREIKKYIADSFPKSEVKSAHGASMTPPSGKKIAIIGAGPAGLTCAWFLRQSGFAVEIFEQRPMPGGMVSAAIPAFRLNDAGIDSDVQRVLSAGAILHDQVKVDEALFTKLRMQFDAVFLAAGAQRSARLKLDGADASGVIEPLDFLFRIRSGDHRFEGTHVVIIGGGNTAMDAARTALRLVGQHGSVTIVYRRSRKEMPADQGEIRAAIGEGGKLVELVKPLKINHVGGKVTGLVCCRTALSVTGKDGRPIPVAIPDSEFEIPCDAIIPAIGQELDLDFLNAGELQVVPGSYKTGIPRVFIGGDACRGASTAINAIADGRLAAEEIIASLKEEVLSESSLIPAPSWQKTPEVPNDLLHKRMSRSFSKLHEEEYNATEPDFSLVESSLTQEEAIDEASRCLECDVLCNVCVTVCPNLANFGYQVNPGTWFLQKAVKQEDESIAFSEAEPFQIEQHHQVLNIRDLCNECGNCTTFCPTSGSPFRDKPGFCLDIKTLREEETGFYLNRTSEREVLIYMEQGYVRTLSCQDNHYIYETDQVWASLNPDLSLQEVRFLTPCVKEFDFRFAATMRMVLEGARLLVFIDK
jgi:putative selenate reductase